MFKHLSENLTETLKKLRGQGRLTEENIQESLRDIRLILLEADVALPVVKDLLEHIRVRAVGREVIGSLTPGQTLIKVVSEELTRIMGSYNDELNLRAVPPAVILMAGLQGAGKTTTAAKLARRLIEQQNKKVMLVSCDIYRPAAIEQLQVLATEVGAQFFPSHSGQDPVAIAQAALTQARKQMQDVLIVDSAGRLHIDDEMMDELKRIHSALNPIETLFVVDSMSGQDAANSAKAFNDALPLSGVILTKTDGDARGGAALSVRHITGKPIKFLGIGEKTAALEVFYPDRVASRILGQGDVLSLIEEVERKADRQETDKLAKKMLKGKGFNLEDFLSQLQQMRKMGGVASIMEKMPGTSDLPKALKNQVNDRDFIRMEAIINSMTRHERHFPAVIKGSRKRRIALGSGTEIQDVNRLLKQFSTMQKTMKQMSKKGGLLQAFQNMKGKMPPGMGF
jgi:signal recognition particle subunit SRP54